MKASRIDTIAIWALCDTMCVSTKPTCVVLEYNIYVTHVKDKINVRFSHIYAYDSYFQWVQIK